MNDPNTSRVAQLFGGGAREREGASSASVLSGAARRLLAEALCAAPAPATLGELRTSLRKVGTRIGVGEMVYNRVSALPQAQMPDSGVLNLDYLCELAGVDRSRVKHDSGPVELLIPRVTARPVVQQAAKSSTRTVRPSAATSVSGTAVTYGPSPRPAPPPRPIKPAPDTVSAPPVADTRPAVATNPKRASAWRSMWAMLRILEEEFNWPKGAGLPTWACHFVLEWQRQTSYASQTLVRMKGQGLVSAPSTSPMYLGQYLWTICDVRVMTRGADMSDVPETELRAQIRHILYYHQDRIRCVHAFKGVKIPKSPK